MKERRFHGPGLSPGMLPAGKRWYAEDQADRKMIRVLDQRPVSFQNGFPELWVPIDPALCCNDLKGISVLDPVEACLSPERVHMQPLDAR